MRSNIFYLLLFSLIIGIWLPATSADCQAGNKDAVFAARDDVMEDLVQSLPEQLPEGALAILQPEVPIPAAVDESAAESWAMAFAAAVQHNRPGLVLTDRDQLNAILREQKLGSSPFADPATAVRAGKLVAARMLIVTRLHELQYDQGTVRVRIESKLIDVENGTILWSKTLRRGFFPLWTKVLLGAGAGLVIMIVLLTWYRRHRTRLVKQELPKAKAELRVDTDGLAMAVAQAIERLQTGGAIEAALNLQKVRINLDSSLEAVRHALPGGAVDRNRVKNLGSALDEASGLVKLLKQLRERCDQCDSEAESGAALAEALAKGEVEIRSAVDRYRRYLV
jgi:hypothetical protein